jgi:hypothetical protein
MLINPRQKNTAVISYADYVMILLTDPSEMENAGEIPTHWMQTTGTLADVDKSAALPIGEWDTKTIMDITHSQGATNFGVRFAPSIARHCPFLGQQCCRRSNVWCGARKSQHSLFDRGYVMYSCIPF